jgi:hypothetical protein
MSPAPRPQPASSTSSETERLVTRLLERGFRVTGSRAQCPAHDDRGLSLHIAVRGGELFVECCEGCEEQAVRDALDLDFPGVSTDVAPADTRGPGAPPALPPFPSQDPGPRPGPGPGVTSADEQAELYRLLEDHAAGRLEPVPVALGKLPPNATPVQVRVAADVALCMGLRLAVDDDRPLPYATSFCADRNGLRDKWHAWRVLGQLVEAAVVRCVGAMPPRPGGPRDGTKLYAPPWDLTLPAGDVPGANDLEPLYGPEIDEEVLGFNPPIEGRDQSPVEGATPPAVAPRDAVGMVTSGNPTSTVVGKGAEHEPKGNGQSGHDSDEVAARIIAQFDATEIDDEPEPQERRRRGDGRGDDARRSDREEALGVDDGVRDRDAEARS